MKNKSPLERIKGLLQYLPQKDIKYANKFISTRDYDSLQSLVGSAIYKIEKNLLSNSPKEEYLSINIEKLNELKAEIDSYIILITGENDCLSDYLEDNYY